MITPKNWATFQHYNDRRPAWIKLHRALLDDYQFACLPIASRALAPLLWLLASEYENGGITASPEEIAFRIHWVVKDFNDAVKPLIDNGFFRDDSTMLADRYQDAIPEVRDTSIDTSNRQRRKMVEFDAFWSAYRHKVGKATAQGAFKKALTKTNLATIMGGLKLYNETKPPDRPWCNPATWLNQERWLDEPAPVAVRRSRTAEHGRRLIMEAQNGRSEGRSEFGLRDEVGDVPAGDVSLPTTRSGRLHRDGEGAWGGQAQIAAKGTDKP